MAEVGIGRTNIPAEPFLAPMLSVLRSLPVFEAACLRNFSCGGLWSAARLHAAGLCDSPLCTACGRIADATHDVWECEADAWFRESWNDPQLFQAVGDAPPSYGKSRLLVETPAPRSLGLPIMPRVISVNCEHATVSFSGISGVDGSLFEGSYRDLARGGWAVSSYTPNGETKFHSLYGPLPGHWHTILRAELYALFILLQHAIPPFSLAIDNFTVVKGLRRGEAYCTLPRRPHADLWRRVWFILREMGAVGNMRVFFP